MAIRKINKKPPRQALLVLGMHRSGTSAISGVLALLGAHAPKTLMEPTKDNPRGYFESTKVMKANEQVLSAAGSRWNDWGQFNPAWFDSLVAEQLSDSLGEVVDEEYGTAPLLLIKDPRICRFLPLWIDALRDAGIEPRIVIPVRHPLAVARSLEVRNHMGRNRSLLLWLRHVLDAEVSSRQLPRVFVRYERLLADWPGSARRIATELGITWPMWSGDTELKVSDFLSNELRHHSESDESIAGDSEVAQWVRQTYEAVQQACVRPLEQATLDNLDRIRLDFNHGSAIYAPVVREHERRVEALYADMKAKLASNVEKCQSQAAMLAEAERKLSENAATLAEQSREAETLRGKLDAEEQAKVQQKQMEDQMALNAATFKQAMELAANEHAARLADQEERYGRAAKEHREVLERLGASEAAVLKLREDAERSAAAAAEQSRQLAEKGETLAAAFKQAMDLAANEHASRLAEQEERSGRAAKERDEVLERLRKSEAEVLKLREDEERYEVAAAQRLQQLAEQDTKLAEQDAKLTEKEAKLAQLSEMVSTMASDKDIAIAEHQTGLQNLQEQLSSREEALAKTSRELSQLKTTIDAQSMELHRALSAAETTAKVRFRETAKLTEMLFQSEAATQKQADRVTQLTKILSEKEKSALGDKRQIMLLEYRNAVTRSALSRQSDTWQHLANTYAQALKQVNSSRAWSLVSRIHSIPMTPVQDPDLEDGVHSHVEILRASGLFDARWYLEQHPDAAESGMEPERHYLLIGAQAGYNPGPEFDSMAYLMEYPDIREAGVNPLVHYIECGQAESRIRTAPVEAQQ